MCIRDSHRGLLFLLVAPPDRQAVQANVAFSDRRHCAPVQGIANHRPHLLQQLGQSVAVQAFDSDTDRRRACSAAHGEVGVKISIQGHADATLPASVVQNVAVR